MKIKVLGSSGSGAPGYNLTSFLINDHILLDAGTVTGVLSIDEQKKIDHIIVTHTHLDHVRDIPLLADNMIGMRAKPISIVSTANILNTLNAHLLNNLIWPDFTMIPNVEDPVLKFTPIDVFKSHKVGSIRVKAVPVNHTVYGVGYIISDDHSTIVFTGDTSSTDELWHHANKAANLKAVIIETSYPDESSYLASVSLHLTPKLLKEEVAKIKNKDVEILVTHMKYNHIKEIEREIRALKLPNVHFLKSSDEFDF